MVARSTTTVKLAFDARPSPLSPARKDDPEKFNKCTAATHVPVSLRRQGGIPIDLEARASAPLKDKGLRNPRDASVERRFIPDENSQLRWSEGGGEKCDTRGVFKLDSDREGIGRLVEGRGREEEVGHDDGGLARLGGMIEVIAVVVDWKSGDANVERCPLSLAVAVTFVSHPTCARNVDSRIRFAASSKSRCSFLFFEAGFTSNPRARGHRGIRDPYKRFDEIREGFGWTGDRRSASIDNR